MSYVDGFVCAVPTRNRAAFLEHSRLTAAMFREYGAQKVVGCWGDDVPNGKVTSFPMAVKCAPDETVVFSWIVWPSRDVRNAGMARVMTDARMQPDQNPMPFDGKRAIFGGFEMVLDI